MGRLLAFPRFERAGDPQKGCVHCHEAEHGGYSVSHESRSGDSWGGLDWFADAQAAVEDAYRLARVQYWGCDVYVAPAVLAACDPGPAIPPPGEF